MRLASYALGHARGSLAALALGTLLGCGQADDPVHSVPRPPDPDEPTATSASPLVTPCTVTSYCGVVMADAPTGYWRLGERAAPTAFDSAPAHNDGTYTGTYSDSPLALLDTPGALVADRDGAPNFGGSNNPNHSPPTQYNWVSVPNSANQAPAKLSLEAWFTIPGTTQAPGTYSSPVLKTTANGSDGYGFYWYPHFVYFYVNNRNIRVGMPIPAGATTITNETPQSRFHHLVGTYDPTANGAQGLLALYFDGQLVATRGTPDATALIPGSAPITIGRGWLGGWTGKVDEVALYDKALSASQVQAHYLAALGSTAIGQTSATDGDQQYGHTIVTPPLLSSGATPTFAVSLANTVADLQQTLGQMTGATFNVVADGSAGIDPHAIRLIRWCPSCTPSMPYTAASGTEQILLNDLAARELLAFAAISDPGAAGSGLKIISRSEAGLTAGVYSYLRLLGARWILPTDRWAILPSRPIVRWNTARVESSDFAWGTTYFAGGGFAWNQNKDKGGYLPDTLPYVASRWDTWNARNLLVGSVLPGGQIGATFNGAHTTVFQDPPAGQSANCANAQNCNLWRARTADNTPVPAAGNAFKWHVSNIDDNGFQSWFANQRLADLGCQTTADPNAASVQCVSAEEADGLGEDLSPQAIGSVTANLSDNMATLASVTASVVSATGHCPGRYASYMAYGSHAAIPSVSLSPNTAVTLVPYYANTTANWGDAFVTAWAQAHKTANLGVQDFWGFVQFGDGSNLPRLDPFNRIPQVVRFWRSNGAKYIWNESTASGGASALPWYIAGQVAWNNAILNDKLVDSTFDTAFGPLSTVPGQDSPQAEMRGLFGRWAAGFSSQPNEVALDLRSVLAAYDLADATTKPRVADFAAYVRYLELYYQWVASPGDTTGDALLTYMWQIHDRAMLQTFAMMSYVILPALSPTEKTKWGPVGSGWATVPQFNAPTPWLSDATIIGALRGDLSAYPVQFQPVTYTGALGPAPNVPSGSGAWYVTEHMQAPGRAFDFYVKPGTQSVTFYVEVPADPVTVGVADANGVALVNRTITAGGWQPVTFSTLDASGHTVVGNYAATLGNSDKHFVFEVAVQDTQPFAMAGGYMSVGNQQVLDAYPTGTTSPTTWFYAPPNVTFAVLCDQCNLLPTITPPGGTGAVMTSRYQVYSSGAGGFWRVSAFKTNDTFLSLINIPSYFSPSQAQVLTQGM